MCPELIEGFSNPFEFRYHGLWLIGFGKIQPIKKPPYGGFLLAAKNGLQLSVGSEDFSLIGALPWELITTEVTICSRCLVDRASQI